MMVGKVEQELKFLLRVFAYKTLFCYKQLFLKNLKFSSFLNFYYQDEIEFPITVELIRSIAHFISEKSEIKKILIHEFVAKL